MNGIDSAAIACGQDWRAIEAAAHAYPYIKYGKYGPLSNYKMFKNENGEFYFRGALELPMSVGIVGGVIQNNPIYENSMRLLGYPNAQQLGEILVCVGLANNFAAMRAMAIEGIQKGHMNLHAKNIALAAGVPHYLSMDAVEFMKKRGRINKDSAKGFLQAIDLYAELRTEESKKLSHPPKNLSTFFLDIAIPGLKENILLNIGLETTSGTPIHISIEKENLSKLGPEDLKIKKQLFGDKGYEWLTNFIVELDIIKFSGKKGVDEENTQKSREVIYKLKLLSVLINLVSGSIVNMDHKIVEDLMKFPVLKEESEPKIKELIKKKTVTLQYGVNLLVELIKIFDYNIDSHLPNKDMKQIIIEELHQVMSSHCKVYEIWNELKNQKTLDFSKFLSARQKRLSATMMLYCDALLLKSSEINNELLSHLKILGDIYEIECTMTRDLAKWSGSAVDANSYTYWLLTKGSFLSGDQTSFKRMFAMNVLGLLNDKKKLLYKLGDVFIEQYQITRYVIRTHYGVSKDIIPEDPKPSL